MEEVLSSDLQSQLQEVLGSSYVIERELGGAGMSRVFVATETDLGRKVVIKLLPPELAAGINIDRFRREIQLAARLQHPHIVPLHAAGAKGGLLYYTMPYIEGENLRRRLMRTRELPIREATKILREIGDALGYAHEQNVVHRDIKPENILISGSHALVTDFGVSKALSNSTAEISIDGTPANGETLTSLGIALGTPAYMAPEQAAGDPLVDARADIYALGILGYELLAGTTPFAGLNQQQTLSAHMLRTPTPLEEHRPQVPPGLAAAIMRCLEKHPADRWQSAGELLTVLESFSTTSGATTPSHAGQTRKPFATPQRIAIAAGIIATGLISSTIAFQTDGDSVVIGATRQMTNATGIEVHPAVSPDGRMIAYVAGPWDRARLYVRQISGGRAIALTDAPARTGWPQWKPDGSAILFESNNHRYLVPPLGGVPIIVPGLDSLFGCSFSHAGDKVACTNGNVGSIIIADASGDNAVEIRGSAGGDGATMPVWSPDDKLIAFSRNSLAYVAGEFIGNIAPSSVWVARTDGGTPVRITDETHLNTSPAWTPDGKVLFVSTVGGNRDIWMQRIGSDLKPRGGPVRITTGLNAHTISIDLSGTKLAYSVFTTIANVWSTPIPEQPVESPKMRQVTTGNQTIETASVSPDEKWIAYDSNLNGNQDIFKMPLDGGEPQQLTRNGADNFVPHWSPDGTQIAYHSLIGGTRNGYVMTAAGTGAAIAVSRPSEDYNPTWNVDGNSLFFFVPPDSLFTVRRLNRNPDRWGQPSLLLRAQGSAQTSDGARLLVATSLNTLCATCEPGFYSTNSDGTGRTHLPFRKILDVMTSRGVPARSKDPRWVYVAIRERDGTSSIWQLPVNGEEERRLVHFTDPDRQFYRPNLSVDSRNFYFMIGDRQSDVWTVELKTK